MILSCKRSTHPPYYNHFGNSDFTGNIFYKEEVGASGHEPRIEPWRNLHYKRN
jgi:hypothetical protein